ncbi:AraC family transcriptional regulator [Xylanibacillus composti]|uniref:AraC family transcriptional regulator n=1 Tax=Xylanibacillus composti TaxID=1572762 RepID=A0A8J4H1A6_9BACL|nr:AraC family transcriptional regulator [Xylanibacillus composti]MDT9725326.1 AraC family transcriptional regulator [Xylanibacillus composti]GIQ69088.1 AraC family transcriptional regulator [Xylanibacillus composti]
MSDQGLILLEIPPVPYYITTGLSVFQPGEQHPSRHNLGVFDLLWVIEGTLYIGEEDQQWEVTSGQTLLLLPDRYHYAVRPCEAETRFYWNHFDFRGRWRQTEKIGGPVHPVRNAWENPYKVRLRQYAAPPEFSLAERHLRQLLSYASQIPGEAYWREQQLFMELLRLLEVGYRGSQDSPALKLAEQTEAYLRQHYQADVTNEVLAEVLHFHPNYIVRCMKEIYRCTPMEYLHEYRLEQAKLLLIKTEWPISRIAEHVGFPYTPYFSRCFKQYAGISPLRFRKQFVP